MGKNNGYCLYCKGQQHQIKEESENKWKKNKNDIDELVKSIDSSFEEMSLKDIVAAHENYFGADDISFDKDKTEEEKKEEKAKVLKDDGKIDKAELLENLKENETKDKNDKTEMSEEQKQNIREMKVKKAGHIGNWFQTFCYMRIPVIGFIYILVMAFSKKTPEYKKEFAKGYILYKILVWILAIVLLYCLYKVGLDFVDGMLSLIKE